MPNYSFQESSKPRYQKSTVSYMYEDYVGEVLGCIRKSPSGLYEAQLFGSVGLGCYKSSYFVNQDAAMAGLREWATERFNKMHPEEDK